MSIEAAEVAAAYYLMAEVMPPSITGQAWDFGSLILLRSVHPEQMDILNKLADLPGPLQVEWQRVMELISAQWDLRKKMFKWVSELNFNFIDKPANFVFPDAYSLLLWIWTFQLFERSFSCSESFAGAKYFYRGESRDYGATSCEPSVLRHQNRKSWLDPRIPGRIRKRVCECLGRYPTFSSSNERQICLHLSETMSDVQAIAVGQHYGCPTSLLDVTTQPEVSMFFATLSSDQDIGMVHFLELESDFSVAVASEMALVTAPPHFSRIHHQSGYFLCTKRPDERGPKGFKTLRFFHSLAFEPVRPTWVRGQMIAPGQHGRESILHYRFTLERALVEGLPSEEQAPKLPVPGIIKKFGSSQIFRWGLTDLIDAAGQAGVHSSGRLAASLDPKLIWILQRFAPVHFYMFVAAMLAQKAERGLEPSIAALLDTILEIDRGLIASGIQEQTGSLSLPSIDLTDMEVMRLTAAIIGSGDQRGMPFPVNNWYS